MLMDRIIGAFTFKKGVYSQTANDASFTNNAWLIVAVVAFLEQLGAHGGILSSKFIGWLISGIVLAVVSVGGFALSVFLIAYLANNMFKAHVQFEQLQRAMGLAYVWHVIGVVGVLGVLLSCILSPITFLAGLAGLAANLFAIKETTNMDWTGTVVCAVLAWVIAFVVLLVAGIILGFIGLL
jgi:hypothetical protein